MSMNKIGGLRVSERASERKGERERVFACSIEYFHLFEKYLNDKCHFQIDGDTWSALSAIEIK